MKHLKNFGIAVGISLGVSFLYLAVTSTIYLWGSLVFSFFNFGSLGLLAYLSPFFAILVLCTFFVLTKEK